LVKKASKPEQIIVRLCEAVVSIAYWKEESDQVRAHSASVSST
jgi:hypothetical protein